MAGLDRVRRLDEALTRRLAAWKSPRARQLLPAVESAAERTKLWWAVAALMAATGRKADRDAALSGLTSMITADAASNLCKHLCERRRPPGRLIPHAGVHDRPHGSSFPSGHTAAAVGFAAAAAFRSPWTGARAAVPAAMVAAERLQRGAHHPGDVAAGAAIGLTCAWLVHRHPGTRWAGRLTIRAAHATAVASGAVREARAARAAGAARAARRRPGR
ncbi:phosphatase PAP2 family protein [Streptomyces sp. NPDC051219]|uniref:phosphatase PAP2 family protein n=1 Tax=Streptomyces sp. NPDC051219 TaxID=3155283 RepID=UPI00342F183C